MANICEICGKGKTVGGTIVRKGLPKKQKGIGLQLVKNPKRMFKPNIQRKRVKVNGQTKKIRICTACIRSGKANKV